MHAILSYPMLLQLRNFRNFRKSHSYIRAGLSEAGDWLDCFALLCFACFYQALGKGGICFQSSFAVDIIGEWRMVNGEW